MSRKGRFRLIAVCTRQFKPLEQCSFDSARSGVEIKGPSRKDRNRSVPNAFYCERLFYVQLKQPKRFLMNNPNQNQGSQDQKSGQQNQGGGQQQGGQQQGGQEPGQQQHVQKPGQCGQHGDKNNKPGQQN